MITLRHYALIFLWIGCILGSIAILPYAFSLAHQSLHALSYSKISLVVVQSALLYGALIILGYIFAQKIGFQVFLFDRSEYNFYNELLIGVAAGTVLGCGLLVFDISFFTTALQATYLSVSLTLLQPLLASFYGGINEEVLMRLFLLPLCIFILSKALKTEPHYWIIWASIVITAFIFGILHLPAMLQAVSPSPFAILRIIILNSIGGIVFGWLFWKKGIEIAMVAHFTTDIIIHVLPRLVLIF